MAGRRDTAESGDLGEFEERFEGFRRGERKTRERELLGGTGTMLVPGLAGFQFLRV